MAVIGETYRAQARAAFDGGLALVVIGAVVIGTSGVLARVSEAGPLATGAWRMFFGFLTILPFYLIAKRNAATSASRGLAKTGARPELGLSTAHAFHPASVVSPKSANDQSGRGQPLQGWPGLAVFATGFFFAVDLALYHTALLHTTVAHSTLIANMAPVIAITAGILFFGERLRLANAGGVALALGGAVALTLAKGDLAGGTLYGNLLSVAAMVAYSFYMIALKAARRETDVLSLMVWSAGFGAIVLFAGATAMGERILPETGAGWLTLAALGVVVHAGGQGLITAGMRAAPLGLASVVLLLQVVIATALGWILLDESLNAGEALAAIAVLVGIALATRSRVNQKTPPRSAVISG